MYKAEILKYNFIADKQYSWIIKANNGNIVCESYTKFERKRDAQRSLDNFLRQVADLKFK